jgi:LL-diaminopimelate aminotransferase
MPGATFYVWIPCPKRYTSTELCARLLDLADVVTTPGIGFGQSGEGYIRAALTVETPRLLEAVERIGKLKL